MFSCIETSLCDIDATQWDAMNIDAQPFMSHAFLSGLEECGCVCKKTGWLPQHIAIYDNKEKTTLLAALPCYLKDHSYGEYIFDWAWADGYQRSGRAYYPKLSCAIPFTPATTASWLIKSGKNEDIDEKNIIELLLNTLKEHASRLNVSSIHALFTNKQANEYLTKQGFLTRSSSQFHWNNNLDVPYSSFDSFLESMSSRKRKNIKRERRRVEEQGVSFKWFTASNLNESIAEQIFSFYLSTVHRYGAQQYLNIDFFKHFVNQLPNSTHILIAYLDNIPIAGGLYFASNSVLYGRYWGANIDIQDLHFETCYYQPIEYAIEKKLERFEAGAQGEHKLARGLMPTTTYSMHWLADKDFYDAVLNYTETEADHIQRYNKALSEHGPFKTYPAKNEV